MTEKAMTEKVFEHYDYISNPIVLEVNGKTIHISQSHISSTRYGDEYKGVLYHAGYWCFAEENKVVVSHTESCQATLIRSETRGVLKAGYHFGDRSSHLQVSIWGKRLTEIPAEVDIIQIGVNTDYLVLVKQPINNIAPDMLRWETAHIKDGYKAGERYSIEMEIEFDLPSVVRNGNIRTPMSVHGDFYNAYTYLIYFWDYKNQLSNLEYGVDKFHELIGVTGPTKALKSKAGLLEKVKAEQPFWYLAFKALWYDKTIKKVKPNQYLSKWLEGVETVDQFVSELSAPYTKIIEANKEHKRKYRYSDPGNINTLCELLPRCQELMADKLGKEAWYKQKEATAQAKVLGITPEIHPILHELVADGSISTCFFHEPGRESYLINQEYSLLEIGLSNPDWKAPLLEIFATAKSRNTFTRSVSSYLGFLFKLPEYLQKHAPRAGGWTVIPKLVNSSWQLEMDNEDENGTTKRRSAMTPIVNNNEGIVVVPYVSMSIGGDRTTYCYSDHYWLQEKYNTDPYTKGIYTREIAEKLNGRDDYGLMFYTLTGSSVNEGTPTFLVIFERLSDAGKVEGSSLNATRVHFHRVRPNRSKNGVPVSPDSLIEECYRYMAGNIRAEEIAYQQGDMMLIRAERKGDKIKPPVIITKVDNHSIVASEGDVLFYGADAKDNGNCVGWLEAQHPFNMPHPEHEDLLNIPAGLYALHRAKSFEANPVSISSRFID